MTRLERYDAFKDFFSNSEKLFNEINTNYKQHNELRNAYGFYIAPGSRNGGQDATVVDVFFGNRPYHTSKKIINLQITTEVDIANGSSLHLFQIDTGYIFITLYPAYTDKHKAQEEFIILGLVKNPKKLLQINYLTRLYKYLVSYLAVTSIEDKPMIIDKLRVFYLRITKKYYIGKVTYEPKIKRFTVSAIKIILTLGFSGFIISSLPLFANLNRNKEIEKRINILIEKQNEIIDILNGINEKPPDENYTIQIEELRLELKKLNEHMIKNKANEK